jgi:hypothetical protein
VAIDRYQVVTGRRFGEARRGCRIVFASGAAAVFDPAGLGRLQQGEAKFAFGSGDFLRLRRELRNAAIARIDDPGGTKPGVLPGDEEVIVGAGNIELGPALLAIVLAAQRRALGIQFGALHIGEKFLARIFGGAL